MEIEALSVSKICNPLGPVQMDFHKNSHLQGLTLEIVILVVQFK